MAYRITLRRDTSANWITNNPVLLSGEPGYETDTARMKIGDGSTLWNDLPYYVGYDLLALDTDLIPATGGTYDLGATAGYSWRDLYLSGNTIYLGDATLSAVGSSVSMDTIILGGPTADGGVSLSATGGYLTSDGNLVVGSSDRLISTNQYETLEAVLDSSGTLNMPLLLPTGFTAICDESHMIDPVVFEGTDWWEFQVQFQVSPYGSVAVMIDNIFPILTNPGYVSGYTFRFTEEDHGIPNYNFDIELNDVVQPGPAGWTSNIAVSQAPEYPSTIESLGAIKITSDSNSIILATDGVLSIPNTIEFPFSDGNNRTGNGNNLQFEKGSAVQKIISTQNGTELVPTVERLVISGGDSYFDGSEYLGEGGDIYLWAGQGENGGDIKVDGGESTTGQGGTVKIRGGYSSESFGGFVEVWSGAGALGGGDISIIAQNGGTAAQSGGEIYLETIGNTTNTWIFKNDGNLRFPDGTIQETAFEGEILPIQITYSELYSGVTGGSLIPGSYYSITDFKNCYDQPDYDLFGQPIITGNYKEDANVSPIIVFAISDSALSPDAYQPQYPKDKIKYDVTFNVTEVTGSPALGRITERIDEFGNRTDYDHRAILFRRYDNYYYTEEGKGKGTIELIGATGATGEVIGTGTLFNNYGTGNYIFINGSPELLFEIVSIDSDTNMTVTGLSIPSVSPGSDFYTAQRDGLTYKQNNISIEYTEHPTFLFADETIISNYLGDVASFIEWSENYFLLPNNVFGEDVIGNIIGNDCINNTFRRDVEHNVIADEFRNNTISNDSDFADNQIAANFTNNLIICEGFNDNRIGDNFNDNKIFGNSGFQDNLIGVNFNNNTIYSTFDDNVIVNGFGSNAIHSQFYANQIGLYFNNNEIYSSFYNNEILNGFEYNTIGAFGNLGSLSNFNFHTNRIGSDFYGNTIRQNFQNNQIGNAFNDNIANGDFYKNIIGNQFSENGNIGYDFYGNRIGNNFSGNLLIGDYFHDNQIGEYFGSGEFFLGNSISYYFNNNQIGNEFRGNTLGDTQYFNWDNTTVENLDERVYDTFYNSLNEDGFENVILGKELIMHDTFNNEYHKVKFTQWTQNDNGGGFSYERTKVYPSVEPTVYFTKTNYGSEIDVIVEGSLEITRGNNGGIYNYADEGGWDQNVSPSGTLWNSIYSQSQVDNNGSLFSNNNIGNQFKGNYILKEFSLNDVKSYVGANQFFGYTRGNNIGDYTFDNDFLGDTLGNTWKGDFISNIFGNEFNSNSFHVEIIDNIIGDNFIGNTIQSFFNDNIIGDNFGFGGDLQLQGNKIGNNFSNNTIGEYFCNNSIPDNFLYNTIGNYFEWNTIDTRIESTDFTLNYGNITGFYYIAGGTSGVDNTYIGLTGSVSGGATGGIGSGASFDIGVTGGTVYSVTLNTAGSQYTTNDTITILGTAIGGITGGIQTFTSNAIGKTGADDTYIGLIAGGTAGGENASFNVTVTSSLVSDIQIYDKGVAYSIGDNLTILGSQFGGTDGSDDISITVSNLYSDSVVIGITGISQTPSVYEEYTCQIFERKGGNKRLSFYDENDILTIKNINE